jgi:riboflavin kinase, archaea type
MSEIKLQHILTMTELMNLGALHNYVEVTTTDLGKSIKKSQQAASKHLLDLETVGYIERLRRGQKYRIKVTDKGYLEIKTLFLTLRSVLEETLNASIDFEGRIVSGMGEGAYYMSLKGYRNQFIEKLGYEPYPGTLNIKLVDQIFMQARREIGKYPSIFIEGFSDNTRTYGWVKCYPASISGTINNAAVLVLERTHYDENMLEVIAPVSIKDTTGMKNGDKVTVKVHIQNNNHNNNKF